MHLPDIFHPYDNVRNFNEQEIKQTCNCAYYVVTDDLMNRNFGVSGCKTIILADTPLLLKEFKDINNTIGINLCGDNKVIQSTINLLNHSEYSVLLKNNYIRIKKVLTEKYGASKRLIEKNTWDYFYRNDPRQIAETWDVEGGMLTLAICISEEESDEVNQWHIVINYKSDFLYSLQAETQKK